VTEVLARLRAEGLDDVPVVVGGIIPPADAAELLDAGVSHVFTPKDYDPGEVMAAIVALLERRIDRAA
jgi:(2R)-ethylmalonyl-CoA mutase